MVCDLLTGHHVIVVDDDERLLALARLALQKQGIRVSTAATAEEGRKIVAADPPDLVILDIVLPDMSGWEVLRRIRETDDCLVMLLSGRDSDIDKARGLDLGADDYLTKPFSFLEFEARVRALLRRAPAREHDGDERHTGSQAVVDARAAGPAHGCPGEVVVPDPARLCDAPVVTPPWSVGPESVSASLAGIDRACRVLR